MKTEDRAEKEKEKVTIDINMAEEGKLTRKEYDDKKIMVKYTQNFKGEIFVLVDPPEFQNFLSQIEDLKVQDLDLIYAIGKAFYKVTLKNIFCCEHLLVGP